MQFFTHDSSGHDLSIHKENHDRLIQCYDMIVRRSIPCIISSPVSMEMLNYFSTKFDFQPFENLDFTCPKCNEVSTLYCEKCNCPGVILRGDNYITAFTLHAIRGCIACIYDAIFTMINGVKYTYLLVRPPGHHSSGNHEGFCFFPNAFFAAEHALDAGYSSVGIFDWDFHHGNGTQKLVEKTDRKIVVASIHGYGKGIYPNSGTRDSNSEKVLNIPINLDKISRRTVTTQYYLGLFNSAVVPFLKDAKIDFLIISNGMDIHKDDSLAGMNVNDDFFTEASLILKGMGIPIMYILEGGYKPEVIARVSEKIYDVMSC